MSGQPKPRRGRGRRVLAAAGINLLALYLPHVVPLFFGHPGSCSPCTRTWLRFFPGLPGLFLGAFAEKALGIEADDASRLRLATAFAAAILLAATWIGSRSRRARNWTALVVLLAGSASAHLDAVRFAA